jgi:tetratricopeptide (TPR) repeat protein
MIPHLSQQLCYPYQIMRRTNVSFQIVLALAIIFDALGANAAPRVPASDNEILETLPFKSNDPVARRMADLRGELRKNPRNLDAAVQLARSYYLLVGEEGDPRYLGYAQAALAPWWEMPDPPIDVQVLRASLGQFRHDFDGALADLTRALERDPRHPQARALRATIHIVQARYAQARADCEKMNGSVSQLLATGCTAMVDGLTGNAASAYSALSAALTTATAAPPAERLWVLIRLAELAQRLDQPAQAEAHFRQALALNIADTFLLAAYADFLLDQGRSVEVVTMLKDKLPSDTLLLRLVLAERRLKLPTAKARESTLAARFAAAQMRGDTVHQQEEARFTLEVHQDAKTALTLASENWKVQREPRDARIFLEAALAAKDASAARPVLDWLGTSRIEDRYLTGLAAKLKGARS